MADIEVRDVVTREEFEKFGSKIVSEMREFKEMLCALHKESSEPKAMALYHCDEEGCKYVTDDIGGYIEHKIDERMRELPSSEETPKRHTTIKEFLDCPECFPQVEKEMLERGWRKAEPKRKSSLDLSLEL